MKNTSKFNQDILGKRLRDDAGRWNAEPSATSSQGSLRSVRSAFREPHAGNGPALKPAFIAALALVLIIAVLHTLKGPDTPGTPSPGPAPEIAVAPDLPEVPTATDLLAFLPENPIEQEVEALQEDVQGTIEFLIGLVPLSSS